MKHTLCDNPTSFDRQSGRVYPFYITWQGQSFKVLEKPIQHYVLPLITVLIHPTKIDPYKKEYQAERHRAQSRPSISLKKNKQ